MMEEPRAYKMVDNPSYTVSRKVKTTLEAYYSTPTDAGPPTSSSGTTAAKTPSKTNKLAMSALIAVFFIAALALSSIVIALVSYFSTKSEDIKLSQDAQGQFFQDTIVNLQDQITKLTLDLNSTQSQLKDILGGANVTRDVVGIAVPGKRS